MEDMIYIAAFIEKASHVLLELQEKHQA